jgi:hypothetical protein
MNLKIIMMPHMAVLTWCECEVGYEKKLRDSDDVLIEKELERGLFAVLAMFKVFSY